MMLKTLLEGCQYVREIHGDAMSREVAGIAYDSRSVQAGYLFVALRGGRLDGHAFIHDAVRRGASVIVAEEDAGNGGVPRVIVADGRRTLACLANNFYGQPSRELIVTGVTGTNGKTTTTYLVKSMLESWGKNVGLIGTIRYMIRNRSYCAPHTTPESLEFQGLLRQMLDAGCTHAVAEISSHALAQHRVDGTVFRVAVFTNLTRDHLDFHGTMENYFRAKERLFTELLDENGSAVINTDDPFGRRLASRLRASSGTQAVVTYGLTEKADFSARNIRLTPEGFFFTISFGERTRDVFSPLLGIPNVYNVLCAFAVGTVLQIPHETILDGIEQMRTIAGRFEKVDVGQRFLCIVDYAHTEDALERLILSARELLSSTRRGKRAEGDRPGGRIIIVFGCGGERDRGKRPAMGRVATQLSDYVIITSDNPRSEHPLDIIREIEEGVVGTQYRIEPDRKKAIYSAVELAREGDIVLIAGKGHEDYQEIQGIKYPFRDKDVLEEAIRVLEKAGERT